MSGWQLFVEPSTLCLLLVAGMVIALGCHLSTTSQIFVSAASAASLQQGPADGVKPLTIVAAIALPVIGSIALVLLFFFMNILRYLLLVVLGLGAVSSLAFLLQPHADRVAELLLTSARFGCLRPRRAFVAAALSTVPAVALTVAWAATLAWPLSNALAVCIGVVCIAVTRLPSLRVCAALLGAFFVYDVFWVFLSGRFFGESVMISVAQGLSPAGDASFPALLTFPTFISPGGRNLLGMGDILLPGLCICFLHRVDVIKRNLPGASAAAAASVGYFLPAFVMYFVGLLVTFLVLVVSGSGQPALLYLVPAVLSAPCIQSLHNKEFCLLWKGLFEVPQQQQHEEHHQQQQQQQAETA